MLYYFEAVSPPKPHIPNGLTASHVSPEGGWVFQKRGRLASIKKI